jgi:hypothetical protein
LGLTARWNLCEGLSELLLKGDSMIEAVKMPLDRAISVTGGKSQPHAGVFS